jgi:hypothetical protein
MKRSTTPHGRWKNTTKKLPEEGSTVLGWWGPADNDDGGVYGVVVYASPGRWHEPENDEEDFRDPDYWMPLPKAPEAA